MSELCLINLKEHKLKFEKLKEVAKRVVQFALEIDKGVYFNSLPYSCDLIRKANARDYFLLTDNFYCDNCEFVSTIGLFDVEINAFNSNFKNRFRFFEELFKIIFGYDISTIEVFLSESSGDSLDDYDEVITTSENFLDDIFDAVLKYKNEMAYGIPNLKLVVVRK